MDAKTFLRQVILCDKHINSKLEQIAQLRALATKITSDWKEDVVSGCGLQDKISSAVAKIVDLEEELNNDIDKFVGRKKVISLIIERVQDPDQVDILYRRYFKFETLEQIACELHFLKVRLLNDVAEDEEEDGYSLVEEFFVTNTTVQDEIRNKAAYSYCEDLVKKHIDRLSVWTIVEVLSFGDFLNLCDVYYRKKEKPPIVVGNFKIVKFLRNAASHNNCLINNLKDTTGNGFKLNRETSAYIATIAGISARTQNKKMGNRFIHDFSVMLYCFDSIVSSDSVKKYQMLKLKDLMDNRIPLHKEYFANNTMLTSSYLFVKKVVDKFAEKSI